MKLVIVESPTKAKTLSAILGKNYLIKASMGHVRDLPKKGLGVDVEHDFTPIYEVPAKSKKVITDLKKSLKDVDGVVLATDLDREGEAIAWHLREILLSAKEGKKLPFERVIFHEITNDAVTEAFCHAGELNKHLFDAQQARRVLDRLVGYKLSPLLWKKVRIGLSAGRVQSVAVRLVVERERQRNAFGPKEYWSVEGIFLARGGSFTALLVEKDGKKIELGNEGEAHRTESALKGDSFVIESVKESQRQRKPGAPLKTSTLQQLAANAFGFSAKRTMDSAQKLFEEGHITYHRTDSLNLSGNFVDQARSYIGGTFGAAYIPSKAIFYKTSSKGAQEAHEAIRPTNVKLTPKSANLAGDEVKVYSLIWQRSLECQMVPALYNQTQVRVLSAKKYGLDVSGSVVVFDGWLAVGKSLGAHADEDRSVVHAGLPPLSEGESVELKKILSQQHFTQPPARYTDATLIKALEELGIGRPSTYAPTISTIITRGYVSRENRAFAPSDVAFVVTELLEEHFHDIVDYDFTAELEEELDEVAQGKREWVPVIRDFYGPFEKNLLQKEEELKKSDVTTLGQSAEKCPQCDRILNIKLGKYGKFLSCSGYPECSFAKPLDGEGVDEKGEMISFGACDKCEDGKMILKQGRFGKFFACSNYPKCKNTKSYLEKIGVKCPKCGEGDVVVKKAKGRVFYGCGRYPDCDFSSWKKPVE